jgi:hypothetical protein
MADKRRQSTSEPNRHDDVTEEASEAAAEAEDEVQEIEPGPGAPMQHGENR